jgi:hypothetical protein
MEKKLKDHKTVNLGYHIFKDCTIYIGNEYKRLDELTTKELYWHLLSHKGQRPTSERK